MTSRSREYWEKRTLQIEETLHNRGVEYYHGLEEAYRQAAKTTQQEIIVLYNKLAANNGISMTEAKRLLTTNELIEFRWTVDEYIKYGRENAINEAWMKELENASLRYRISRLEAMKIQMQHHAECVMSNEVDGFTRMLSDMYTEGYYRTAHMIQTGLGVGHSFAEVDTRRVEKVLGKPWAADGKNFSERIWGSHRPALVNDLHKGLTQSIIRGEAPDKLINKISKSYDVAKNKAGNLVMTESAYFGNVAQQDCYAELDVEEQQFTATLDTRTSDVCQHMDGVIIKTADIVIGENAPPLHCRCRSVMSPYFEGNRTGRAARDADGNYITVPGDMTYEEWYDQYIKGKGGKSKVAKAKKPATLKDKVQGIKADLNDKEQTLATHKKTLKAKKQERVGVQEDIDTLESDRMELQRKQTQYNAWKDLDMDKGISGMESEVQHWQQRVDDLQAKHNRYYARPERGTAAYDEWRTWRRGVDFEDLFNNLVNAKQELLTSQGNLKRMQDMRAFMQGIDIDDLNKQLAKIDEALVAKQSDVAMLTDDIAHVTDDIAKVESAIEGDYQRAGKAFIDDLDLGKLKDTNYQELRRRRNELARQCNEFSKKHGYTDEWKKLYQEYQDAEKAWKKAMDDFTPNADVVRSKLAEVRPVGASNADDLLKVHLNNTKSAIKDSVVKAYDYYPTDWVDTSVKHSNLTLKKVDRGHYNDIKLELYISGATPNQQFRTALHELGHRFEHVVDGITDVERVFYARRTKGDTLQWLGKGYKKNEMSRFDEFLNKYMGKEYPDDFYELVSMGFELGYTDPLVLLKDEDMAQLIYGILTLK